MLRCKEGDLALVLGGPYTGFFVTVGAYQGSVRCFDVLGVPCIANDVWTVNGPGIPDSAYGLPRGAQDKNLQPIRPAPPGITTETKKEITA